VSAPQTLNNSQSAAEVCLPEFAEKCHESLQAFGIGETPLDVLLQTRLRPTSRTKKLTPLLSKKPLKRKRGTCRLRKRVLKFCGWCRWCGVPLRQRTKPPKDCSNTCAKAFSRHVDRLGSLDFLELKKDKESQIGHSGGLKAIWGLLKVIERDINKAVAEENHAREKELRATAGGLLCRTPRSRSEFDHAAFDIVERPALYTIGKEKEAAGSDMPVQKFRRSVPSHVTIRIPKSGRETRTMVVKHKPHHSPASTLGVFTAPPEPTPVAFDNHAPRYRQPANPFPPEEKLVRAIFKKSMNAIA
jgi:hypothetical protein